MTMKTDLIYRRVSTIGPETSQNFLDGSCLSEHYVSTALIDSFAPVHVGFTMPASAPCSLL